MMSLHERRIFDLIEPAVVGLGLDLVGVELGTGNGRPLVRIFIDSASGITVDDCERASRQIGALLDVEDPLPDAYVLEVSSPGLDRPLMTPDHFTRFAGRSVRLSTREPIDGRRKWTGELLGCHNGNVLIRADREDERIPLALVKKANLIPEV